MKYGEGIPLGADDRMDPYVVVGFGRAKKFVGDKKHAF